MMRAGCEKRRGELDEGPAALAICGHHTHTHRGAVFKRAPVVWTRRRVRALSRELLRKAARAPAR